MTAPTAEDVIAEAIEDAYESWRTHSVQVAAAVVAAIRGMSVEQRAELIEDGEVEGGCHAIRLQADGMFWPVPVSRVVGPWRTEP